MIFIREGSHTHTLLLLLAYVGEYPAKSLRLLGKERTWKALVQKLTRTQEYRLTETGKESLALPYEIELKANESIVFMVYTVNNQSDVVGIVIEEIENKPPVVDLPDDEL